MSQQVNTQPYGILIMAMTLLGAVVNVSSIILLSKTKRSSMFHSLLKILSLYDLVVIFGCSALYALPNEWNYYRWEIYPFLLPWLLPIVQIAMMSSVYCTVVMSFERYVRICYICQLRGSSYLTEENYKFYVMAFTLGPLLFYAPKFFEIRTEKTVHEYTKLLNCSQILVELAEVHSMPDVKRTSDEQDCLKLNLTLSQLAEHSFQELLNVTRSVEFNDILPTQLRLSSLYYKIYCIGFNSVFASVVPLASLFYLNICTIIALRKMKLQVSGIEAKTNEHPLTKRSQEKASVHYRNGSHRIRAIFSQSPGESRRSSSLPEQEDEVDEKLGNTSSLLRPPSVSDTYASQLNSSRGNDVATSNSAKKTSSQCCQGCLTNTDQIEVIQTSSEDSRSIRRKTMIATDDEEDDGEINNSSINTESLIGRAGLTSKLEYIDNLGFDSIWLSPIYEFGGVDMGNDVTNHSKISPLFGTEQDFDDFLAAAATFNMKVIIEFIPNHTSKKHEWFIKSEAGVEQYRDYYTWSNETNDWKSVTNNSVWSYSDKRGEYYLHNYLPEMPELNLDNPSVRQELLDILKYYLEKPSIMGIHIGAFNILFESSLSNTLIVSDVKKTMDFLHEINNLTEKYSAVDGLERLILLEMLDNEFVEVYRDIFHNKSSGIAVVPFSFGSIPIEYGFSGELTGNRIHNEIIEYYDESPNEDSWPCWEMHDHEMVKGLGRFPININNILFMLTLLLPGTSVMYYGDEIGMSNSSRIAYEEMKDPYTLKYCTPANYSECISRDHSRTPMQWTAGKNGGFTNASKPWLPLNDDYKVHNVEVQQNSYLDMFRNITKLRQMEAFKTGKVYFPFFDEDIFSFLRKAEGEKHAYMVVVYINGIVNVDTERKPQKMKRRLRNHVHDKTLDFTRIMPDFPETGTVIAMTDLASEDSTHYVGEILQMSKLGINKFEGFVIELDFEHKSYEEEGEH